MNRDYGGTEDFFVDIAVELVLERRSLLDRKALFFLKCVSDAVMTFFVPLHITLNYKKKVAVLPLLCAASLLLASFWTPAASNARLENQHQDHEPGQHHLQSY